MCYINYMYSFAINIYIAKYSFEIRSSASLEYFTKLKYFFYN
jgi:hypothetical protein